MKLISDMANDLYSQFLRNNKLDKTLYPNRFFVLKALFLISLLVIFPVNSHF